MRKITIALLSALFLSNPSVANEFKEMGGSDGVDTSIACAPSPLRANGGIFSICVKVVSNDPDDESPYVAVTFGTDDFTKVVKAIGPAFSLVSDDDVLNVAVDKIIPAHNGGMVVMYGADFSNKIKKSSQIYIIPMKGEKIDILDGRKSKSKSTKYFDFDTQKFIDQEEVDSRENRLSACVDQASRRVNDAMSKGTIPLIPDLSLLSQLQARVHSEFVSQCMQR
jgi:hypothetical protein